MIEFIAGLLSGIYLSLVGFNFTDTLNIPWWIMITFGILWCIGLGFLKVYLVVSDYKGMAESGLSVGKSAYRFINSKIKK